MSNIENLKAFDPFADAAKGDDESVQDGLVHVRIQQRNGRKTLTSVQVGFLDIFIFAFQACFKHNMQGLSSEYDLKKIIKVAKKEFACNGTVVDHSEYGEVLQLQVVSELLFVLLDKTELLFALLDNNELLFGCLAEMCYFLHF